MLTSSALASTSTGTPSDGGSPAASSFSVGAKSSSVPARAAFASASSIKLVNAVPESICARASASSALGGKSGEE